MRLAFRLIPFFYAALLFPAPAKLSDTGLYEDPSSKIVSPENRLYVPQYPLWTDGAKKKRWFFLPSTQIQTGKNASETDPFTGAPDHWTFPVGTKFWKEFSFEINGKLRRTETRLMQKSNEEEWEFATYLWNEAETDALLAPEDGVTNHVQIAKDTFHDIPSQTDCLRCHRRGGDPVLGFDALQLSDDRDPFALHAEMLPAEAVTLRTLIHEGRLSYVSMEMQKNPRIHSSTATGRAVMGYLHSNCASCHNPFGSSMHMNLNFRHLLNATSEETENSFRTSVGKITQIFSIPNEPKTYRIKKGDPNLSAVIYMMEQQHASHMPPLGAKILDKMAIRELRKWVSEMH